MRRNAALQFGILLLVGMSLLWARVTGTHLHVCVEDCAAAPSVHLDTASHHAAHHDARLDAHHDHTATHGHDHPHAASHVGGHAEFDLPLFDNLLTKTPKSALDLPLWLPALLAFVLVFAARVRLPRASHRRVHAPPLFLLRPPLRGPPLPTS